MLPGQMFPLNSFTNERYSDMVLKTSGSDFYSPAYFLKQLKLNPKIIQHNLGE